MEVLPRQAGSSSTPAMISRHCDICYCYTNKYITTPCKHKCCGSCYLKIDKCHMCRASLPQVFKVDLQIHNGLRGLPGPHGLAPPGRSTSLRGRETGQRNNITVPFYFCRGDINIDMNLNKTRNTYIIYNILASHNLAGFMDCIQPEDITIDMNKIKIDRTLSLAVLVPLTGLAPVQDFDPLYKADDIINSYFNKDLALSYIIQPSDEELEIESETLFKNVLTLIRLAIAVDSDHDCLKPQL